MRSPSARSSPACERSVRKPWTKPSVWRTAIGAAKIGSCWSSIEQASKIASETCVRPLRECACRKFIGRVRCCFFLVGCDEKFRPQFSRAALEPERPDGVHAGVSDGRGWHSPLFAPGTAVENPSAHHFQENIWWEQEIR